MSIQFIGRDQIHARAVAVAQAATATQGELHLVLCSILVHTRDHGDYTALETVMNGLPNGMRVKAINAWVRNFTSNKLTMKQDAKSKVWSGELRKDRNEEDFLIDDAVETTFADFTTEKEPSTITVKGLIKMLAKRAHDTETNQDGSPKVSPEARKLASVLLGVVREQKLENIAA